MDGIIRGNNAIKGVVISNKDKEIKKSNNGERIKIFLSIFLPFIVSPITNIIYSINL